MRYFLHIAYHGANYCGWQRHPDGINVQQVLEAALTKILKTEIAITGCGRTDAQVHASQFFFHIDVAKPLQDELLFRLNKLLPDDIAIFDIIPADPQYHARFDAVERTYNYYIHTYKDPFLSGLSSLYPQPNWDLQQMAQAVALLTRYTDYRAFCKSPDRNDHTICNIAAATLYQNPTGDRFRFEITANRFLSKMVRIIVGRLIMIGVGKLTVEQFEYYLIHNQTPKIHTPAHPQGLYLSKVTYPYLDIPAKSAFSKLMQDEENWIVI
jgi:tRNA pseudouridine38-40 synthase